MEDGDSDPEGSKIPTILTVLTFDRKKFYLIFFISFYFYLVLVGQKEHHQNPPQWVPTVYRVHNLQ